MNNSVKKVVFPAAFIYEGWKEPGMKNAINKGEKDAQQLAGIWTAAV